jgi:hypothetical protein
MNCIKCDADLGGFENKAASICVRPHGTEETRVYFLCEACDVYTVLISIEPAWEGETSVFTRGPIPREKGDRTVERIRQCSAPDIVSCQCPVHREMQALDF